MANENIEKGKEAAAGAAKAAAEKLDGLYNKLPLDKINEKLGGKVDVKSPKFKLGVLIALVVLVVLILWAIFGGSSPKSAFNNWRDAIISGNLEKANKYSFGDNKSRANEGLIKMLKNSDTAKLEFKQGEIVGVEKHGKYATVKVMDSKGKTSDMPMVDEGGWKIRY